MLGFNKEVKILKVNSTACALKKNRTFHHKAFCTIPESLIALSSCVLIAYSSTKTKTKTKAFVHSCMF